MTIRDVAERAGVSPSTVSYVLTGNKKLTPDTEARVRASIDELGYRPHAAARALSLGRNGVVGLLVNIDGHRSEVDADIFMRFVRSAMFAAQQHGCDLMIMSGHLEERTSDPLVDALVVMDVRMHDQRIPGLVDRKMPAVLVGMPEDALGLSAVDLDFERAAGLAVNHLAALGHASVAVLVGGDDGDALSLVTRFRRGIVHAGMTYGVRTHCAGVGDSDAAVNRWLDQAMQALGALTAVVVLDVGALDALRRCLAHRGAATPQAVSLLVVAPDERMALLHPDTTIVDLPGRRMMERAVTQVMEELSGAPSGVRVLLEPELIDRGSTAQRAAGLHLG